jgi:hypothetical protein
MGLEKRQGVQDERFINFLLYFMAQIIRCSVPSQVIYCLVLLTFQVLQDTRVIQKEINFLCGKLDRIFAVTDEIIFKVCTFMNRLVLFIVFWFEKNGR